MFHKFDPRYTMSLQGFDRRGASGALWGTTANSGKVSGGFKDFADFCVLNLWDADNVYEHKDFRYLPNFDLSGTTLSFDLKYNAQIQDIGSIRNPWISWDSLSWQKNDNTSGTVRLVDHATVTAGNLLPASASWELTGTPNIFSEISFYYQNIEFTHFGAGTLTAIRDSIVDQIRNYPWTVTSPALALRAVPTGSVGLEIFAAIYGQVNTNGISVTWTLGYKFKTLFAGDLIRINGVNYTILTVVSATVITLTGSAGIQVGVEYLANFRGDDGNYVEVRQTSKDSSLTTVGSIARGSRLVNDKLLSGGNSNCTWRISLDFDALGLSAIRKAWLTFAPKISNVSYAGQDWDIEITNVTHSPAQELSIAGVGSVRVGSIDRWCKYTGFWSTLQGFYYLGFARTTANFLAAIEITYSSQYTHDLYIGCVFKTGGGSFQITHPSSGVAILSTNIAFGNETTARRKVFNSIPAGIYKVDVQFVGSGSTATFDFLEAVVPTTTLVPITPRYADYCPACDYGTDQTYKISPQRLVKDLVDYGYGDRINEYISVFWHLNRIRVAGTIPTVTIVLAQEFHIGDSMTVILSGIGLTKTLQRLDTEAGNPSFGHQSLTDTFRGWINSTFAGVYAETPSFNTLVIYSRTALFSFTDAASIIVATTGTLVKSGNLLQGSEGLWQVDDLATTALSHGAIKWHEDFFTECVANGFDVTAAVSMEYLNPPEAWAGRYNNGVRVLTATGFGTEGESAVLSVSGATPPLFNVPAHGYDTGDSINSTNSLYAGTYSISVVDLDHFELDNITNAGSTGRNGLVRRNLKTTHVAFNPDVEAWHSKTYTEIAAMQIASGMVPRLQFGEFLWWFFSNVTKTIVSITNSGGFLAVTTDVPHALGPGETVLLCGIKGLIQTTAQSTSVTSKTVITNVSWSPNYTLAFLPTIRGGSMGFYDSVTVADALVALGVPLHVFNTQNDDITSFPTHVEFLRDRISAFMSAIAASVRVAHPSTEFEILHATDVSRTEMYLTLDTPYPQGGRVNGAVNWADSFQGPLTAPFEFVKIECLSWGVTYRVEEPIKHGIKFPTTAPNIWTVPFLTYLMPNFNPGCPQNLEFRLATDANYPNVALFALDHIVIFSWPLRKPVTQNTTMEG